MILCGDSEFCGGITTSLGAKTLTLPLSVKSNSLSMLLSETQDLLHEFGMKIECNNGCQRASSNLKCYEYNMYYCPESVSGPVIQIRSRTTDYPIFLLMITPGNTWYST